MIHPVIIVIVIIIIIINLVFREKVYLVSVMCVLLSKM